MTAATEFQESGSKALIERRLRLAERLAIETSDERQVTVFHTVTCARLQLSRSLFDLVQRFRTPSSLSEVAPERVDDSSLGKMIQRLLDKGFLVDAEQQERCWPERLLQISTHTLFHCPRHRDGRAVGTISVVGFPSDLGSRGIPGMRFGPAEVRRRSYDFDYRVDTVRERPVGWFDVLGDRRVLEGVTFCDWGDVDVVHGEPLSRLLERLGNVCDAVLDAGSFPCFLGGDHSLTYAVVDRMQRRQPIYVLCFDAHTDFDESLPAGVVNHSNVMFRCWSLPGVRGIVQVGLRGFTLTDKVRHAHPGVSRVTVGHLHYDGVDAILAALPEAVSCYLSIDINVLDPAFAPGTSNPVPSGLQVRELCSMLSEVCSRRKIIGLDLVEVNPERDFGSITAITSCHVLLSALGGAMTRL